jgi:hypothetical protein
MRYEELADVLQPAEWHVPTDTTVYSPGMVVELSDGSYEILGTLLTNIDSDVVYEGGCDVCYLEFTGDKYGDYVRDIVYDYGVQPYIKYDDILDKFDEDPVAFVDSQKSSFAAIRLRNFVDEKLWSDIYKRAEEYAPESVGRARKYDQASEYERPLRNYAEGTPLALTVYIARYANLIGGIK